MKIKATYVFVLVVALLSAYVVYDLRNSSETSSDGFDVPFFSSAPERVEEIILQFPSERIVLRKVSGIWMLTEPVGDVAEEVAVQALLMQLYGDKGRRVLEEGASSKIDFTQTRLTLTLKSGSGESVNQEQISIAQENAFDGSFYAKRENAEVLLADKGWSRVLELKPSSLRSRRIFPMLTSSSTSKEPAPKPEQIQFLSGAKQKFSLKLVEDKWKMAPDPGFEVESIKVDKWLDELQGLRANDFVAEIAERDELNAFGLNPPMMDIQIDLKNGSTNKETQWTLKIGNPIQDDIFLQTNLRSTIYKLKAASLNKIAVTPDFFRDGKRFFEFALEKASLVEWNRNGKNGVIKKADLNWIMESGPSGEKSGSPRVLAAEVLVDFFKKLKSLEAVDFPIRAQAKLSKVPALRILDSDGKTLLEIFVGAPYQGHSGFAKGVALNYVLVTGQNSVLGVKSSEIEELTSRLME